MKKTEQIQEMANGGTVKNSLKIIFTVILAVMLADTEICGIKSAVCVILAGALPPVYATSVFIGSLLRYFFAGEVVNSAVMICGMFLITCIRWINDENSNPAVRGIITVFGMVISGGAVSIAMGKGTYALIGSIVTAFLLGICVFFVSDTTEKFVKTGEFSVNGFNGLSLGVNLVLLTASLCHISIGILNLGRICGVFIILCIIARYGKTGGVISGALVSCGSMLCNSEIGITTVFLSATGLLCGFVAGAGKIATGLFFIGLNTLGLFFTGLNDMSLGMEIDMLIGSVLFMALPVKKILYLFSGVRSEKTTGEKLTSERLCFISSVLGDIRENAETVSEALDKKTERFIKTPEEICDGLCGRCRNKNDCWETNFNETDIAFKQLSRMGNISEEIMPSVLQGCLKKQAVADAFDRRAVQNRITSTAVTRVKESRKQLYGQIDFTENILEQVSRQIRSESISQDFTEKLCMALDENNIDYELAVGYIDKRHSLLAEIYCPVNTNTGKLHKIINELFTLDTEMNIKQYGKNDIRIIISETSSIYLETGWAGKTAGNNSVSGDVFKSFNDGFGNEYMIISDGMGNGQQARLEAEMTVKYFSELVCAGIECKSAVKLVNSIMLTKSEQESFATLDIIKTDIPSGKTTMLKYGSAPTLIMRNGSLLLYSGISFPVGILSDVEGFEREINLRDGDVIIMMSDGVDEKSYKFIKSLLSEKESCGLQEIAEAVAEDSAKNSTDDITVAIARLKSI